MKLLPKPLRPGLVATLYAIWLTPFLFTIAVVTPPWQNSDEPLHFARAVQIAHGGLLGYRAWGTAGGMSDNAIYDAYRDVRPVAMHPERRLVLADLAASGAVRWHAAQAFTSFPNTAQYPPLFYLPDALAYWIGRAFDLSVNHTLLLARLANATCFMTLTVAALILARRTRFILAGILLLPMTLSLAASASQDSLMLAATALGVAALDGIIEARRRASLVELWLLAALLASVAMARPPYAGFLLAILLTADPPTRREFLALGTAAFATIGWCLATALHTSVRLGNSDWRQQLALLEAHPGSIASIAAATFVQFTPDYWRQFIGRLGWTDTPLPLAYTIAASVVLVLAALASMGGQVRLRSATLIAAGFAVTTIFVLQYLTWTWPGQPLVTGVLGRYFLPIAMILALALPATDTGAALFRKSALAALLLLALITPPIVLHALILRYYLPIS